MLMDAVYNIEFSLSAQEKIIFESSYPWEELMPCCDQITISLMHEEQEYIIAKDDTQETMGTLQYLLKLALKKELKPHPSITQNIGFMWNEELQDKPGFVYKEPPWDNTWVGQNNLLWSVPGNVRPDLSTWLYNNPQGDIILEITPTYPWHFDDNAPISYQDFMRDYKPFLIRNISPSIAKTWLAQAEDILKMTEQNKQNAIEDATKKSSILE